MKILRNKKQFSVIILAFLLLLQIFSFVGFDAETIEAVETKKIIDSMKIMNEKDTYFPGEKIGVEVNWSLPNDSSDKNYKAGDSFEISIPEGISPNFSTIDGGNLVNINVVGDKVVVTFTDNVEGLMERKGAFFLQFIVDTPDEEGDQELDLTFKDENNLPIDKEWHVTVKNNQDDIIGEPTDEVFSKGAYDGEMTYSDQPQWFIRVNQRGKNKRNKDSLILTDRVSENQEVLVDTITITKGADGAASTEIPVSHEEVGLKVDTDKRGFEMSLNTENGEWYTIIYQTKYVGDFSDASTSGMIPLKNEATLLDKEEGFIPMDHGPKDNVIELEFNTAGWSEGVNNDLYGKFKIKKVDALTGKPLENVTFVLKHMTQNIGLLSLTTGVDGIAEKDNVMKGLYQIVEVKSQEGYIADFNEKIFVSFDENKEFELVVTNDLEPIEISFDKEWLKQNGDVITHAPKGITVQLLGNNKVVRQVSFGKGEEQRFTFKNLPQREINPETNKVEEIIYTIREIPVDGYKTDIVDHGDGSFTIKNYEEPKNEKIDITVRKKWFNKEGIDQEAIAPVEDIRVILLADGIEKKTAILKKDADPYELIFEDMPKYNDQNEIIKYEVVEAGIGTETIEGFDSKVEQLVNTNEFIITNVVNENVEVKVSKKWYISDQEVEPIKDIEVTLLANGVPHEQKTLSKENQTHTFTNLDKYDIDGNLIEYKIQEEPLEGFEPEYEQISEDEWLIKNHKNSVPIPEPSPKISLRGTKQWQDSNGDNIDSQEAITIKLFANGVEQKDRQIVLEKGDYDFEFKDLPQFDDNDEEIEYEIKEQALEGYRTTVTYHEDKDLWVITNKKESITPGTTSIKIIKNWENINGDKALPLKDITFVLYANHEKIDEVTFTKESVQEYEFTELSLFDEEGKEIEYLVKEKEDPDFVSKVEQRNNIYYFTNIYDEKDLIHLKGQKIWKDKNNNIIKPQAEITVELYANDIKIDERTLTTAEQNFEFNDLNRFDDAGEEINYHVKEELAGYKTSVSFNEDSGEWLIINRKVSEPTIPNTGIKLTYAPYLLIFLLALMILVIGGFKKFRNINK